MTGETLSHRLWEILRFARSSILVLGLKLLLLYGLTYVVSAPVAYAITHGLIFFASYFLHTYWTFKERPSWASLYRFFLAVFLIKLLDWSIFTTLYTYITGLNEILIAVLSTVAVGLLRYVFIRSALRKGSAAPSEV